MKEDKINDLQVTGKILKTAMELTPAYTAGQP